MTKQEETRKGKEFLVALCAGFILGIVVMMLAIMILGGI